MGVDQLVTGDDATDPVVDSITTDDATHNNSYTDPNGNTYSGVVGALAAAGYSEGDFVPMFTIAGESSSGSTSNSSYGLTMHGAYEPRIQWDQLFPSAATTQVLLSCQANPGSDQLDVRIRNFDDSETVLEQTGITGSAQFVTVGPTSYTPTTTDGEVRQALQIRNGDNATSVTLSDPTVIYGVQL